MLQELLNLHREQLNYFLDHLDLQAVEELLERLVSCKGTICLTGVGKSGCVAEKVATTMTSTGTHALFLSPTNLLHGDIGIVRPDDVFLLFSKSGATEELLHVIPAIRNKGAYPVAITNTPESRLAKASAYSILLPMESELCPFGLAPTTSATTQLIFGDLLTIALMKKKNFSLDDYALNHPAGCIGKRVSLRVSDLMVQGPNLPTCTPGQRLIEVLGELSGKGHGCLLVTEETTLCGIFTDGDLRRAIENLGPDALQMTMEELMTTSPRISKPESLAWEALKEMEANQQSAITAMPVVAEDRKLLGLIRLHDILQSGV